MFTKTINYFSTHFNILKTRDARIVKCFIKLIIMSIFDFCFTVKKKPMNFFEACKIYLNLLTFIYFQKRLKLFQSISAIKMHCKDFNSYILLFFISLCFICKFFACAVLFLLSKWIFIFINKYTIISKFLAGHL